MLHSLKRWIGGSRSGPDGRALQAWAKQRGFNVKKVRSGEGLVVEGQSHGQPWRMGANEATTIYMPSRGSIAGVSVQPGWYSLYAVPGQTEWRVFVNSAVERWGVPIDDGVRAKDVGSGVSRVETADNSQEAMRLQLIARQNNAADLVFQWDRTRIRIPVVLDPR